jgi:ribosome-associated translation inhibitor RaiA
MQTTITARHVDVSDGLRERAMTIVERLGSVAHRPIDMTVVFEAVGLDQIAELRLHLALGEMLVARGDGPDHRTALDRAEEKLRRQVERASDLTRRPRQSQQVHRL